MQYISSQRRADSPLVDEEEELFLRLQRLQPFLHLQCIIHKLHDLLRASV